jgi:CheY-like chemotaxis protein
MLNKEPSNFISKNDLNPIPKAVVVNDNVTQLKILCGLLHKAGLDPVPFKSAEAALAAMGKVIPDLIITDVYMPGIDGLELTWERADPALAHLPIIALTILVACLISNVT